MQFKVIVVVDHCLGGHSEERFTVIDSHFEFRLFLVHASWGANSVSEIGQTKDALFGLELAAVVFHLHG